jgi:hypothetical protein
VGGAAGLRNVSLAPAYAGMSMGANLSVPAAGFSWASLDAPAPVLGRQVTNIVNIEGLVKARDPFEIATQMERFQQTGVLADEEEYR